MDIPPYKKEKKAALPDLRALAGMSPEMKKRDRKRLVVVAVLLLGDVVLLGSSSHQIFFIVIFSGANLECRIWLWWQKKVKKSN